MSYRAERIERLFKELEYEMVRGVMEGEINETQGYRFWIPASRVIPDGSVCAEFTMRPVPRGHAIRLGQEQPQKLRLVEKS